MHWLSESEAILGILVTQVVGALVVAVVLHVFYRQYGKAYLAHWSLSWLALVFVVASSMALQAPPLPEAEGRAVTASALIVRATAAFLHIGLLGLGFWELTKGRQAARRSVRRLVLGLVAAGVVLPVLAGLGATKGRLAALETTGAALAGVALTILGVWIIARRGLIHGVGVRLASIALIVYGLHLLHYAAFSVVELGGGPFPAWAQSLAYSDFLIQLLVGIGMIASLLEEERHAAYLATREFEHVAYHDALTGLPNRPLFLDRLIVALAQGERYGHKVAVFFLDVDHFKDINDSLGHSQGDALLKELATRIKKCVRAGDTVARFGGDEFTIFVQYIDRVEDIGRVAEKLLAAVKAPIALGGQELFVTVSVGISFFPLDGADPETLLKNADAAMYRAKEQGRDTFQIYAPAMNACAVERLSLENQLRKALELDELAVYYQPLVDLETRTMYGAEALLRWRRSDGRIAGPVDFIRTLETSGLIIPVGDWVLRRACAEAASWKSVSGQLLEVSVNLGARQFQRADLVERIALILEESKLAPDRLQLEITENCAMQNAENSVRMLRELKKIGVRIALDDFGTGYSSLNYLRHFPIDTLKLDRAFVLDVTEDENDAAIATAVISMAQSLGLTVIAEGIEKEDQLAFLRALGCRRGQGFLFGRPMPVEEFTACIDNGLSALSSEPQVLEASAL